MNINEISIKLDDMSMKIDENSIKIHENQFISRKINNQLMKIILHLFGFCYHLHVFISVQFKFI